MKIDTTILPIAKIEKNVGQIEGLPGNPRFIRDKAFDKLVKSIKENPEMLYLRELLVYPYNGKYVIIGGNMRFEAMSRIGLTEAPCKIIPAETSIEDLKAYTIKDNAGYGEWNFDFLANEWDEDLLSDCCTTIPTELDSADEEDDKQPDNDSEEDEEDDINERERTYNTYNLHYFDRARSVGAYNIPTLNPEYINKPQRLIGFNYALSANVDKNIGIHCFLDDYQIERLWSQPDRYVEALGKFGCIFTPDYSLYNEMPTAMMIWNTYRSRLVGQILQDSGLHVIPSVSWSGKESFDFCFDGIPNNSIVAISTIGVKSNPHNRGLFNEGFAQMIERVKPREVWCYGGEVELECDCKVHFFDNEITTKFKQ